MAHFDFTNAAAKGYEFVWRERVYLFRVAVPVIFVKLASVLAIFYFDLEADILRQDLLSLPVTLLEAILMVSLIRFYVFREPIFIWGGRVPAPDIQSPIQPHLQSPVSRDYALKVGVGLYLLVCLFQSVFGGVSAELGLIQLGNGEQAELPPPSPVLFLISLGVLGALFWCVRLMWVFVPETLGVPARGFLKHIHGFASSIPFILTALICYLPLMVLMYTLIHLITGALSEGSALSIIIAATLISVGDLMMTAIQVIAMTCGVLEILSRAQSKQ